MKVWVAGRRADEKAPEHALYPWSILGIYLSESAAVERCVLAEDFVGPVPLNEDLPDPLTLWPDAYYPNTEAVQ